MPKIIKELRDKILFETKKELDLVGYDSLKLRNIANKCNIAVGTIYNYFTSKEYLVACILGEDWKCILDDSLEKIKLSLDFDEVIKIIYEVILSFYYKYKSLFESYSKTSDTTQTNFLNYHIMLRGQICELIDCGLKIHSLNCGEEETKISSELLLSCSMHQDIEFRLISKTIKKILEVNYE